MTPEKLAELQLLRQTINDPNTEEGIRKAAVRVAVQMVRDERGIIFSAVEKKATKKKADKIDPEKLLSDFIGESNVERPEG